MEEIHGGNYRVPCDLQRSAGRAILTPQLPLDLPGRIDERKLGPVKFKWTVIRILTDQLDPCTFVSGSIIVLKENPSVGQFGHHCVAVARFVIWSKHDAVPG